MENGMDKSCLEFDLTDKTRVARNGNHGLVLRHLSILNCDTPCFSSNDSITFALKLTAERPLDKLCILFRLQTNDGIVLGSSYSKAFEISSTGEHTISCSMPLELLASGEYFASIGIARNDAIGRPLLLEYGAQLFKFEIQKAKTSWNASQQGYILLPELTIH